MQTKTRSQQHPVSTGCKAAVTPTTALAVSPSPKCIITYRGCPVKRLKSNSRVWVMCKAAHATSFDSAQEATNAAGAAGWNPDTFKVLEILP